MWKRVLLSGLALVFTLTTVAVVAVGYQKEPQVLTVNDDSNDLTQCFQVPQRIVVLESAVARLMQQWQRENLIVATSSELKHLFSTAEDLGPVGEITVLQLAATRPDLIICGAEQEVLVHELRTYGYAAIMVRLDRLSSLLDWPEKLADLLTARQQAAQTVRLLEKELSEFAVQTKSRAAVGKRVIWLTDSQFTVAGRNTLEDDLLQLVGVVNVGAVLNKYTVVQPEDLTVLDPQVIIAPEVLRPAIEKVFWADGEQMPLFLFMDEWTNTVGWHDVLSKAENLALYLEALLKEAEQGAVLSAGN